MNNNLFKIKYITNHHQKDVEFTMPFLLSSEEGDDLSISEMKQQIYNYSNINILPSEMRIIYRGHVIDNDEGTIKTYNIIPNNTEYSIIVIKKNTNTNSNKNTSTNPLDMLNNNQFVSDMMKTPFFQSVMQNPQIMQSIIKSNPQMNALIENNPEIGQALNDPEMIETSIKALQSPNVMRELSRTTDRQISNLESTPIGMNALMKLHNQMKSIGEIKETSLSSNLSEKNAAILKKLPPTPEKIVDNPMPNPWNKKQTNPFSNNINTITANNTPNNNSLHYARMQYYHQLQSLHEYGFNNSENVLLDALIKNNGDLDNTINYLLELNNEID